MSCWQKTRSLKNWKGQSGGVMIGQVLSTRIDVNCLLILYSKVGVLNGHTANNCCEVHVKIWIGSRGC